MLTLIHETAAGVFARTGSVMKTAKSAGITPTEVEALLEDAKFLALVKLEQKQLTSQTLNKLGVSANRAVSVIHTIMSRKSGGGIRNAGIKLQAAKTLLDTWLKVQELIVVKEEIEAIKRQLADAPPGTVIDVIPE